jgi:hypothetical protein
MTTTCSSVTVVKNEFFFLMYKASVKNAIYSSTIQIFIEYEIVSFSNDEFVDAHCEK